MYLTFFLNNKQSPPDGQLLLKCMNTCNTRGIVSTFMTLNPVARRSFGKLLPEGSYHKVTCLRSFFWWRYFTSQASPTIIEINLHRERPEVKSLNRMSMNWHNISKQAFFFTTGTCDKIWTKRFLTVINLNSFCIL